jgi:hypothetical protein
VCGSSSGSQRDGGRSPSARLVVQAPLVRPHASVLPRQPFFSAMPTAVSCTLVMSIRFQRRHSTHTGPQRCSLCRRRLPRQQCFLVGFRNRVAVMTGWLGADVTFERGARLIPGLDTRGSVGGTAAVDCARSARDQPVWRLCNRNKAQPVQLSRCLRRLAQPTPWQARTSEPDHSTDHDGDRHRD